MRESWRWFGPNDPVTLHDIRQTGATDIVTALHHIPIGEVWPEADIREYQALIEAGNNDQSVLRWSVVESIPVHEDIKLGLPGCERFITAWANTLRNLAAAGIQTVCYNFMPVIDWTRTDLQYRLPNGAYALRFDQDRFAAFDLFVLKREGATADYSEQEQQRAQQAFEQMSAQDIDALSKTITAGLPGRMTESYGLEDFRAQLGRYRDVNSEQLLANLLNFLKHVVPVAEEHNIQLAIHPDDPPWPLFGLPRIICTPADLRTLFARQNSPANGITLCVGTYGSRPDNDLVAMADEFHERIFFAHLRGVSRDADEPRSFVEASHLDSDIDMIGVIARLLAEDQRRAGSGPELVFRPDHGHQMLDDVGKQVNPGYSAIGRLKGLAEIRGVIRALQPRL